MRQIYLSPHPDDAALCAGGLIHEDTSVPRRGRLWIVRVAPMISARSRIVTSPSPRASGGSRG